MAADQRLGLGPAEPGPAAVALAAFADDMATARQLMTSLAAAFSLGSAPETIADAVAA